jgi:hypothetical protein
VNDQKTELTVAIYGAIDAFQRTHRLPGLQHAQIRGLLAEHLARVLPASAVVPAADRAALRDRIIAALDNAHRTHPCPALGDQIWSGCVHYDEAGRVAGVGSCHSGRRADAVLSVLPAPADRAAEERLARVLHWVTSDVVTAKTEFGNGYRAAQRDIRDLIRGRFDADAANELRRAADHGPAVVAQPGKDTETRVGRCSAVMMRQPHAPHGWEPQPGMDPVPCPGFTAEQQPKEA